MQLKSDIRRPLASVLMAPLMAAALFVLATPAEASTYHPWRFSDPSKVLYKISNSSATKVPSWMVPFVKDAADAWSETPTPLNLITCPSNSCSLVVRAYHADDGAGGNGGCYVWDSATGVCAPNKGYVNLNIECTGGTCGPQKHTPRYDKWIVMHELGHAIGLSHSGGKHSVMSYGSCTSEAWCVSHPNAGDAHGVNVHYPSGWANDGGGASCSIIRTTQDRSGSSSTQESGSLWNTLLGSSYYANETVGGTIAKSGVDSPITDKLTFHDSC